MKVIVKAIAVLLVIGIMIGNPNGYQPVKSNTTSGIVESNPIYPEMEKPEALRLFLPWADDTNGWVGGTGYNQGFHVDNSNQTYAIDFNLSDQGGDIYPTAPGNLIYADWLGGGYGNTVILRHDIGNENYYFSLYAHLNNIAVSGASKLEPPEIGFDTVLGNEGMTGGTSTGPHLHYALFVCSKSVYEDLFEGDEPRYLYNLNNGVHLCYSVKPEPMIGRHIYESFNSLNRIFDDDKVQNVCKPGADVEEKGCLISERPTDYWTDTSRPIGDWAADASSGVIAPGEDIKFHVTYSDSVSQIKEVRLTVEGETNGRWLRFEDEKT